MTTCPACDHDASHTVLGCEHPGCTCEHPAFPPIEDLRSQLARLVAANDVTIGQLRARQIGISMDLVHGIHLSALLDTLLGPREGADATPQRLSYELVVQAELGRHLAAAQQEHSRRTLLAGVPGQPTVL